MAYVLCPYDDSLAYGATCNLSLAGGSDKKQETTGQDLQCALTFDELSAKFPACCFKGKQFIFSVFSFQLNKQGKFLHIYFQKLQLHSIHLLSY